MSASISAIKCTSCAAPLDILGGGRVSTVTCSYCNSVLDLNDNYAVLSKFNKVKRPLAPFEIGMRGNIKGVEWTIIGWVTYKTIEFPSEEWNEFFLYSSTHGYAWLVYEDGKVSFSMKVRNFDLQKWQKSKPKMVFYQKGHYALADESYMAYIDFVEGELNWVAKFGDKFRCWDYNGVRHQSLSIEKTVHEVEVFHTQKLDSKDIYYAFSLDYTQQSKTHKGARVEDHVEEENAKVTLLQKYFMLLPLIIAILSLASLFYHKSIYKTTYTTAHESTFSITSNAFLTSITLKASDLQSGNHQLWIYQGEEKIFYIDKTRVFYNKSNIKKTWCCDAISMTSYLNLEKGRYRIVAKTLSNNIPATLEIQQQVIRNNYFLPLLLVLILVLWLPYVVGNSHIMKAVFIVIPAITFAIIFGIESFLIFGIFGLYYYFHKKDNA